MKHNIGTVVKPFDLLPSDPYYKSYREKSIKVLTTKRQSPILKLANKMRKDGKVATQKYIKTGSVLLSRAGLKIALTVLVALALLAIA